MDPGYSLERPQWFSLTHSFCSDLSFKKKKLCYYLVFFEINFEVNEDYQTNCAVHTQGSMFVGAKILNTTSKYLIPSHVFEIRNCRQFE